MLFLLFAFWIILNGRWTTEIAITGGVISALLYLFICKFMDYSPRKEWSCIRRMPGIVGYFIFLVGEIFVSAWATIRLIWSPKEVVQPELTSFRTKLRTDPGKVVLANSITMTPGTITVDIRDDQMLVHCLDESMAEGLENSEMEKRIIKLEGSKYHE